MQDVSVSRVLAVQQLQLSTVSYIYTAQWHHYAQKRTHIGLIILHCMKALASGWHVEGETLPHADFSLAWTSPRRRAALSLSGRRSPPCPEASRRRRQEHRPSTTAAAPPPRRLRPDNQGSEVLCKGYLRSRFRATPSPLPGDVRAAVAFDST